MFKLRNIMKSIKKFNLNDGAFEITVEKVLLIVFVLAFVVVAGTGLARHGVTAVNNTTTKMDAAPGTIQTNIDGITVN